MPGLDPPLVAKRLEGGECRDGYGRGLLKGQVGRLGQHRSVLVDADVLGERPAAATLVEIAGTGHLVPWLEPGDVPAHRLDAPGHVGTEPSGLGPGQPGLTPDEVRRAPHEVEVQRVDGSCPHADQYVVVARDRQVDFLEREDVR